MSEREPATTKSRDDHSSGAIPLELRLAGTSVGTTTPSEVAMLELRCEVVLILGVLRHDGRLLSERLQRSGRSDAVATITGSSSIEKAVTNAQAILRELDDLLAETVAPV